MMPKAPRNWRRMNSLLDQAKAAAACAIGENCKCATWSSGPPSHDWGKLPEAATVRNKPKGAKRKPGISLHRRQALIAKMRRLGQCGKLARELRRLHAIFNYEPVWGLAVDLPEMPDKMTLVDEPNFRGNFRSGLPSRQEFHRSRDSGR